MRKMVDKDSEIYFGLAAYIFTILDIQFNLPGSSTGIALPGLAIQRILCHLIFGLVPDSNSSYTNQTSRQIPDL